MNNTEESKDIYEIAKYIFSKNPQGSNSIQLIFEKDDLEHCYQELLILFTEGMKILYGDKNGRVNLQNLSESQMNRVQEYFKSFGIELLYTIEEYNSLKMYGEKEIKTELKDYIFRLKCENQVYSISFTFSN